MYSPERKMESVVMPQFLLYFSLLSGLAIHTRAQSVVRLLGMRLKPCDETCGIQLL